MALTISFLVISVAGCAFIYPRWIELGRWLGIVPCLVFVIIMGGVHCVGYRLLKRQQEAIPAEGAGEVRGYASLWAAYGGAIRAAIAQQCVVLLLSSLVLDGGQMLRVSTFGAVGCWSFVVVIVARRPRSPTQLDLLIVTYGFWLAILAAIILAPLLGRTF